MDPFLTGVAPLSLMWWRRNVTDLHELWLFGESPSLASCLCCGFALHSLLYLKIGNCCSVVVCVAVPSERY